MFYSASKNGFYDKNIHLTMPEDSVEISDELYSEVFAQQSIGKQIVPDKNGLPSNIDQALPNSNVIRRTRSTLLSQCDWTMVSDAPLTDELKTEWKTYRQALRDITKQPNFPQVVWPTIPGTINTSNISG